MDYYTSVKMNEQTQMNLKNKILSKINVIEEYLWSDYIYLQLKKLEKLIYWLGMHTYVIKLAEKLLL